jgi:hypothetical protein
MNPRWLRDHLSVLIFSVIFVVVLGGSLWFVHRATQAQKQVMEELDAQQRELSNLRNLPTFPSKENIELVRQDYAAVAELFASMRKAASRPVVTPPVLEREVDFSQWVRQTVAGLERQALARQVSIPRNFFWGFSRYAAAFPCRNPPLRADDCKALLAQLAKQLRVVELLGQVLMEAGVEAITAVRRTEIESGADSSDSLPVPIQNDPKALYHTYPFELQFVADTVALRAVINRLTQAESLFVIRSVRIDSTTVATRAASLATPASGDSPRQIEGARRLNVTLRVDLVEFVGPSKS